MHFALPTRGNNRSSPFLTTSAPRSYIPPALRRRPLYALVALVVFVIVCMRSWSGNARPSDAPKTVMVLVLNRTAFSTEHINRVVQNREEYAKAHGPSPLF